MTQIKIRKTENESDERAESWQLTHFGTRCERRLPVRAHFDILRFFLAVLVYKRTLVFESALMWWRLRENWAKIFQVLRRKKLAWGKTNGKSFFCLMQVSPKIFLWAVLVMLENAKIRFSSLSLWSPLFSYSLASVVKLLLLRMEYVDGKFGRGRMGTWLCCKLMQGRIVALSPFHNCAVESRVNVIFWVKTFSLLSLCILFYHRG